MVKRASLLVAISAVMLLLVASVALANPHSNYATTTNKCKVCHTVHDAPGTYKLLSASSAETACDYCHAPGGQGSSLYVYTVSNPSSEHTLGSALSGTPISTKNLSGMLYCFTCHSVHGANAMAQYILKVDPAGDGGTASNANMFCADCHDKATASNSHIMTTASNQKAFMDSTNCSSCHAEPGGSNGDYPHTAGSYKFLGEGRSGTVVSTAVDNNCLKCHWDSTGNEGVGKTY
ncbi:MAG: cytochrome c3 family protein [Candidatus Micrarchaeia archaeon]